MCWSVFLCLLHRVSSVGLCYCFSYTVWHVLVCVLMSLPLCVKSWHVFLCLLQCVSSDGLCSCVSYTVRTILACVLVSLTLCVKCWPIVSVTLCVKCWSVILSLLDCVPCVRLCSCVSYTVCQVLVKLNFLDHRPCVGLVLVSLALCVKCWSLLFCHLRSVSSVGLLS